MGLSEQQVLARLSGIGGSEAGAALGLSARKTQLDLYLEKTGAVPPMDDNEWLLWGRLLEPVIRQQYSERTGRVVRVTEGTLRHPKYPFILGHPDGGTDDRRLVEIKTARSPDGFGEPGTDQVPTDYLLQTQHYLILTGFEVADLAVLIGGSRFCLYEIPADPELQEMLIDGEAAFWQRVEKREPPEPSFEDAHVLDTLKHLYPGTDGTRLNATPEQERWRAVYAEACSKMDVYKSAADAARAHLVYEMGQAAMLAFQDGKVLRRKLTKRKGYTVDPTEFMDCRLVNDKEG